MSLNTIATNRQLRKFSDGEQVWLFGYGSLIFKTGFDFIERRAGSIDGWTRRFWQGSHDHRGSPQHPGRVVTLVRDPHATCYGMAYLIAHEVFEQLDLREKNGYLRVDAEIRFESGDGAPGLVYIADPDNAAFLGPASDAEIARQVATAAGPSGQNRDYVLALADALRQMQRPDAHVSAIENELLTLSTIGESSQRLIHP